MRADPFTQNIFPELIFCCCYLYGSNNVVCHYFFFIGFVSNFKKSRADSHVNEWIAKSNPHSFNNTLTSYTIYLAIIFIWFLIEIWIAYVLHRKSVLLVLFSWMQPYSLRLFWLHQCGLLFSFFYLHSRLQALNMKFQLIQIAINRSILLFCSFWPFLYKNFFLARTILFTKLDKISNSLNIFNSNTENPSKQIQRSKIKIRNLCWWMKNHSRTLHTIQNKLVFLNHYFCVNFLQNFFFLQHSQFRKMIRIFFAASSRSKPRENEVERKNRKTENKKILSSNIELVFRW